MAVVVLDASVLIAHLDAGDVHHAVAKRTLLERGDDDLRMSASAYAETLVGPIRKGWLERARADLVALLIAVDAIDASIAEQAAGLRARHRGLGLPDALVIAHGESFGADAILTTDRRWRRVSEKVEVLA